MLFIIICMDTLGFELVSIITLYKNSLWYVSFRCKSVCVCVVCVCVCVCVCCCVCRCVCVCCGVCVCVCVCVCVVQVNPTLWGQNVPTRMAISKILGSLEKCPHGTFFGPPWGNQLINQTKWCLFENVNCRMSPVMVRFRDRRQCKGIEYTVCTV